jgi:CheY-like chemotaxis protein
MASPKILLVDDIRLFLEMQKDVFRRDSFNLYTATGGWEALEIMAREKPDLVFMDFFMPQGRGDQACAKAKSDPNLRKIPIVIVTNSENPEDLAACRAAGCNEILFKPIDRDQFLQTSYRYLGIADPDSARVKLRLPVRFGQDPASMYEAWSFDVGSRGIFVETTNLLPSGTELHLEITLPTPKVTLAGKARVARTHLPGVLPEETYPKGLGLQFLDFSKSHLEILSGFLRRKRILPRKAARKTPDFLIFEGSRS